MKPECAVCKGPAVTAVKITQGNQSVSKYLCERCLYAVARQARVKILGSAVKSLPGLVPHV